MSAPKVGENNRIGWSEALKLVRWACKCYGVTQRHGWECAIAGGFLLPDGSKLECHLRGTVRWFYHIKY
jgi:hypothetical protein